MVFRMVERTVARKVVLKAAHWGEMKVARTVVPSADVTAVLLVPQRAAQLVALKAAVSAEWKAGCLVVRLAGW